jgi:pimeloyl-ACP methyl ester carboxylesterase
MKIGGDQVTVLGHSFGGGIAIKLAHKFPERVSAIILINSIGSPVWISNGKATQRMSERPLWNWGQNLIADLILSTNWFRVFPHILVDALPNLIYRPLDMWKVATMIRRADLSAEIKQLKQRKLPVLPVWSDRDQLISKASFDALCQAIGHKGKTVRGSHAWLIENPDIFIETVLSFLSLPHNFNKRDFPIGTGTWLPARG